MNAGTGKTKLMHNILMAGKAVDLFNSSWAQRKMELPEYDELYHEDIKISITMFVERLERAMSRKFERAALYMGLGEVHFSNPRHTYDSFMNGHPTLAKIPLVGVLGIDLAGLDRLYFFEQEKPRSYGVDFETKVGLDISDFPFSASMIKLGESLDKGIVDKLSKDSNQIYDLQNDDNRPWYVKASDKKGKGKSKKYHDRHYRK